MKNILKFGQTSKQKNRADHHGDAIIGPANPAKARSSKRKTADSSTGEVIEALLTDAIAELASSTSVNPSRNSMNLGRDPHSDGSTLLEVMSKSSG